MTVYTKFTTYRFREKKDDFDDYAQRLKDDISRAIKQVMNDRDINQTELAELTGMKKSQTSRILNGKMNLTLETLNKIATGLGLKWTLKVKPEKEKYNDSWSNISNKQSKTWKQADDESPCLAA